MVMVGRTINNDNDATDIFHERSQNHRMLTSQENHKKCLIPFMNMITMTTITIIKYNNICGKSF